ncbi:hypothetical protein M5W83_20465 [Paenibacillus thiaminolyticus]|uniref:Uncharacterized protein n=1 Tax=Paenibacillus thiaminolyticus TaxID=49283 RepID=A0AAP9DTV0_PANTH|nr:hypothetical protein [Paenibacillus thiaminolyticus]MCY9535727.1 hypothetical protein [Paenibacillus thiaminolyticus]MCY9601081.1 hypothetical protein [Paenibacillus thiaminolyticus]MCY9609526.1 hypothetical protein [Paenibacillus thiaminolyticus]MCY9613200.1 hypothetical protein [Paenibacillus thiaminolyticus]MCY9617615.1 hypothetical protein [Paenibacillus thiaminolyticus]
MPLIPIQRLTSSTANVVSAADRVTAVNSLLSGAAPNVVNVGNAPLIWPQLAKFDNDNTSFAAVPNPQFVWTQPTFIPGETHGFAAASVTIPLQIGVVNDFLLALTVFADNAVTARIQAFSSLGINLFPVPGLDVDLNAGSLNPVTGITTDVANPYNWQNVRFYSIPASLGLISINIGLRFVFSFQVTNYLTNGAINTAGLAFAADIYQNVI